MKNISLSEFNTDEEKLSVVNRIIANQNQIEGKLLTVIAENKKLASKSWVGKLLNPKKKGAVSMKMLLMLFITAIVLMFSVNAGAYTPDEINDDIASNHVLLAQYLRDSFANITSNSFLFTPTDTAPAATEGMLYYNDSAKGLKLRTDSAWVDIDVSGASSLDASYTIGQAIGVDAGAVTLTGTDTTGNVLLALDQQDTDSTVAALTVTSTGNAAAIIMAQTGSGTDIQFSDGGSISKVSALIIEGGITDLTDGSAILMDTNNEIQFGDGGEDISFNFATNNTVTLATDSDVATFAFGVVDDLSGVGNIAFDTAAGGISLAGTTDTWDLTIAQTGTVDSSLILTSAGSVSDALSLITTDGVGSISLVSADNITRTAADDITDTTTDGPYTLTIGGSTNGKYVSTVADTFSLIAVDAITIQNTEAGKDVTLDSVLGSVVLSAAEDAPDAINIDATAGGIDIDATGEAGDDIALTNTGGSIHLSASEAVGDAISLTSSATAGGIDITSGTGDLALVSTDDITLTVATAATDNITITNTAGTAADAIKIIASAGGIDIDAVGASDGDLTINAGDNMTIVAVGTLSATGTTTAALAGAAVTVGSIAGTNSTIIQSGTGDTALTSTDDITLTTNTGATENITLTCTKGTAANAIGIQAGAGGIDIDAIGAGDGDLTMNAGDDMTIAAVGALSVTGTTTAAFAGAAVTIGSVSGTNSTTIQSGTGDLALTSTDDITLTVNTDSGDNITITNTPGTAADAISITATAGGVTIDGGTGDDVAITSTGKSVTVTSTESDAAAIALVATTTAGGITATTGTSGVNLNASVNQPVNIASGTSTGTVTIGGSGAQTITIGDTGITTLNVCAGGTGAKSIIIGDVTTGSSLGLLAGTGNFTLNGNVATTYTIGNAAQTGTIKLGESSATCILNLGTGIGAHTIHIGDGETASQVVEIGSVSSASSLTLQAGSGNHTMTGAVGTTYTIGNAAQTGAMKFGESSATGTVDIGTGTGARTVTVGGVTGAAATTIQAGTGDITITSTDAIKIGENADQQLISIGNVTDASALTLESGTGDITLTSTDAIKIGENAAAQVISIGNVTGASSLTLEAGTGNFVADGNAATTYTIGNSSQTGTMKIGESDATMILNLGTGAGAHTIHIGDGGTAAQLVTIGSTSDASALTLQSGTGDITVTGEVVTSGVSTFTAGAQSGSVALEAQVEANQQVIVQGSRFVTVSIANDADDVILLPATAIVGNIIRIVVPATGCELQTDDGGSDTINTVDCSGANELALTAGYIYEATCTAANTWVVNGWNNVGAAIATLTPDADS